MESRVRLVFVDNKYIPIHIIYSRKKLGNFYVDRYTNNLCLETQKKKEDENVKTLVIPNISTKLWSINKAQETIAIDVNQSRFRIFEKTYQIKQANLQSTKKYEIVFDTVYLNSKFNKKQIIRDVYTNIALEYITRRVKYWQIKMGLTKYKIDIHFNWNRRRLGCCYLPHNNLVRIDFTNRIFAYSKPHVDCIIVHELSHIPHAHHRKSFWDHVEKYIPNYYVLHNQILWL